MPGEGTTLQESDKELGVFEGKRFADAVFSIWLGSKPAFEDPRKGDARLTVRRRGGDVLTSGA